MATPNLTAASFPTLYTRDGQPSTGTVTGTGINVGNAVTISGMGQKWTGSLTDRSQGDTYNAAVTFQSGTAPVERRREGLSVTVTDAGTPSNAVSVSSEVEPVELVNPPAT